MNKITLEQLVNRLKKLDEIAILTHKSPDADTLGSAGALCLILRALGKHAHIHVGDKIPPELMFLVDGLLSDKPPSGTIITVDVASEKLLSDEFDVVKNRVDICIDHHKSNTFFAKETYLAECAANAEIIYDIALKLATTNPEIATRIYAGIVGDTGGFKFANTTDKTHEIAADLMRRNIKIADIHRQIFRRTSTGIAAETEVLQSIKYACDKKIAAAYISKKLAESLGGTTSELDGIGDKLRDIEGVFVSIVVKQDDLGMCKISLRSNGKIDVSAIAAAFGGGGHFNAAGCRLEGDFDKVFTLLTDYIQANILDNHEV